MSKRRILTQYNSVYLILLIICISALIYRPSFFSYDNVNLILRQASALGILTLGHIFVISCGCVDLSVVATMQMSIAIFMLVVRAFGEQFLLVGIICSLLVALFIGAVNGAVVAYCNVQPFLATLFIGTILGGVRKVFSGVTPLGTPPAVLTNAVKGGEYISYCVLWFAAAAAVAYLVLNKTVFGRKITMVGTNAQAALFSGVHVKRTIFTAYCISALTAVAAAIVATGYLGFADQTTIGDGMEMDSLVAAVLGGNYLSGGRASVSGAIGGVLAMTLMKNIVILFGLTVEYQYVLKGLVLIAVVFMAARSKK